MSGIFILGLFVLAISICCAVGIYFDKDYSKDFAFVTGILFLASVGVMIYGYNTYSTAPWMRNQYDHGNGYMTVVEYNMAGDSIVKENIRTPKTTYGKVVDVKRHSHFVGVPGKGGHNQTYYMCTVKLDDGRTFTQREHRRNLLNHKAKCLEVYYPSYHCSITIFD